MGVTFDKLLGKVLLHNHVSSDITDLSAGLTVDTRENIFALSPSSGDMAYSSDTEQFFVYDGTDWQECGVVFKVRSSATDAGAVQDSSPIGVNIDVIHEKTLTLCKIGKNGTSSLGGLRINPTTEVLQVYQGGEWGDVVSGVVFRENSSGRLLAEHLPDGFPFYVNLMDGDSEESDKNEVPFYMGYESTAGSVQEPYLIGGFDADILN